MQDENPCQSPTGEYFAEPDLTPRPLSPASEHARLPNFILDTLAIWLFASAFGIVAGMTHVEPGIPGFRDYILGLLCDMLVVLIYYVSQEALMGKTLAKFITHTKVVSADGGKPSFSQIVGRTFCRMIPFELFSFVGHNPVGWHDKFSNTRVVMDL